ncbi:YtxH domain-containing protein [Anoxybacillus sp. J5B_2022]|uniref:YtxH domain-containing protein n=1 Tax=Anoxybacillus sp. J5B_2022 TaxID=3003246 RepID=UPI0022861717|nr:YtxH domain-containing protein [Anoxybacillus sp. J5B_2022]MCZ0755158.1 YtxH domain-containing protein [Anoxybacillus sp. J5B_2022]
MGKNNGGFLFGAIVGGVVGAATAIFLTSEKGKKWLAELNENEALEPIKETANEWLEIAREKTKEVAKFVPLSKTEQDKQEAPQEEITSIPIPIDNKESIEKLLKETEAAFHEAEQKLHEE